MVKEPCNSARWHSVAPLPLKHPCLCNGQIPTETHKGMLESAWKKLIVSENGKEEGGIVCISLQGNEQRVAYMTEQFHRLGLCRIVIFFRPTRFDKQALKQRGIQSAAKYGCWDSHRKVCLHARRKRWKILFELEDDVEFRLDPLNPTAHLSRILADITTLSKISTWDIVRLGHHAISGRPVPGTVDGNWLPRVWECNSYLTHALLWSAHGYNEFLRKTYEDINLTNDRKGNIHDRQIEVDKWMVESQQFRNYAIYPQIAVQNPKFESDISGDSGLSWSRWYAWTHKLQYRYTNALDFGALVIQPLIICILVFVAMVMFSCLCIKTKVLTVSMSKLLSIFSYGWHAIQSHFHWFQTQIDRSSYLDLSQSESKAV